MPFIYCNRLLAFGYKYKKYKVIYDRQQCMVGNFLEEAVENLDSKFTTRNSSLLACQLVPEGIHYLKMSDL